MAYINLPISLDQMFNDLGDRISRVETGYNGPQVSADAAQGTAVQAATQATVAQAQATVALQQATAAYAYGVQSIQISSQTIVNASNQLTAMNTNGITVYSGASSTSGARVVMNSAGITGFNSTGVTTFAINAANGAVSTTGAVFTSSTITGGSLNINGNAIIDSSGYLTATGATITGTIYATSGSFTGSISSTSGSIGGWSISSTQLYSGSTYMSSSTGVIYAAGSLQTNGNVIAGNGLTVSSGASTFSGNINANAFLYNAGYASTTGAANMRINTAGGLIAYTSSSKRYKVEIEPETIPAESVLSLVAKSYFDKTEYEENDNSGVGLQRWLGLIAEDIAELPVLKDLLVEYKDGEPNSVYYDRIAVVLIPLLQEHEARLNRLEGK
jgi:hypothetical protein